MGTAPFLPMQNKTHTSSVQLRKATKKRTSAMASHCSGHNCYLCFSKLSNYMKIGEKSPRLRNREILQLIIKYMLDWFRDQSISSAFFKTKQQPLPSSNFNKSIKVTTIDRAAIYRA
ncbi:hypothetical protein RND71_009852 [Anisodus tanguticus]|uniref:Uncharacterized protein n=1 Tax=Anisodus tanguticus TaxID=243964 RepID=A0AAE1SIJ6_9SOLA|nr:hypothetical protein RND71_009852 [Anisodus tanguticus]